jgi:hypothetical protein
MEKQMAENPKTKFLNTRVTPSEHEAFVRKSKRFGEPSWLLRELITGFIEDRISVKPPVTTKEELYVK